MDSFGASAPGNELFNHFDITADEIIRKARKMLDL
jgi:transketolase